MWTTLALMTMTLAPAQAGNLEVKNARFTQGLLGQTRKEQKFLPGDVVYLQFDVDGMTVKENGTMRYVVGMEVLRRARNGQNRPVLTCEARELETSSGLGRGTFRDFAYYSVPRPLAVAGDYTIHQQTGPLFPG